MSIVKWIEPVKIEDGSADGLSGLNPLVRQLLFSRGIRTGAEAEQFLNPDFNQVPDPLLLYDSSKAVLRIEKAIDQKERIFIHGDFDVDGVTATAILWEYLYRERNADALPYIPSRVDEGYGLTEKSVQTLIEKGAGLIMTVDCGIRDVELVKKYRKSKTNPSGVDFIITDHHELAPKVPAGCVVVHPGHPRGKYPYRNLSGAAVAWMLVAAIEKSRSPKKFNWTNLFGLDLVALSTVCDLMPITGVNRVLVKHGLERIKNGKRVGLNAMLDEAGIMAEAIESYHLGYVLGPRINAAGRIGDAVDALKLLTTTEKNAAKQLAEKLGKLNKQRQELTEAVLAEVYEKIEEEGTGKHLYFAYKEDWPEGIVGLVAGKVQEKYHRPVIVATRNGDEAKGSARSISCFNIVEAISKYEHLLKRYGGHSLAAGFTVDSDKLGEFKSSLQKHAQECLKEEDFVSEMPADAIVDAGDLTWDTWEILKKLEPFGYGNRRPVFWIKDAVVIEARGLSENKHIRMTIKGNGPEFLQCIYFNGGAEWVGNVGAGDEVELIGHLDVNNWNGSENLQFRVEDMKKM